MAEANYPSNAHKARQKAEEQKEEGAKDEPERIALKPIVVGGAKERKPPLGRRIAETFVGDDAKSVGSYIFFDVVMPAVKATISDAVSQGIERMLFGDVRRSSSGNRTGYTRYSSSGSSRPYPGKPVDSRDEDGRRTMSGRARASHNFKEIVIDDRGIADAVIDGLIERIDEFGVTTVSDLYDLVDITGTFQDVKWGWYTMKGAQIRRVRDGWLLDLPRPEYLE